MRRFFAFSGKSRVVPLLVLSCLLSLFFALSVERKLLAGRETSRQRADAEHKAQAKRYPSDWAWRQRTFPYGTADKTAHLEALAQAQRLRQLHKPSQSAARWRFAGPLNIGGRITDIEFDPFDATTVYAGAATGGVFKSVDGGETWQSVFDEQAVLPIGDLAVDPNQPGVLYAGTGEANGGHNNFPGGGVFKSSDGGMTWQFLGLAATTSIGRLLVDPSNSQRVFVAAIGDYFAKDADRGVYRSDDAGASWQKVLFINDSTGVIDLVINPENPAILFAAAWERIRPPKFNTHLYGRGSGIYRSSDGGDTWQRLGAAHGLPAGRSDLGRIGLALCATQPDQLYALFTNSSYTYDSIYRSQDGGDTWQRTDLNRVLGNGFANFSWYFGNIRVDPNDPARVFVLDLTLQISEDGGSQWQWVGTSHVDHHALTFDPSHPQRLLVGHDGGIDISEDGGWIWRKVALLPVTQFYQITVDASNPGHLLGGTQDNGTLRTRTGSVDDWEEIYGGDGFYVIVDHTNPNIIYAESQFGALGKSVDGGQTFSYALNGIDPAEPTNWATPVVMDPNNSAVLYYGTNRIYRTTNSAVSWQAISGDLTDREPGSRLGTITTIAVALTNSAVIYAGTDDGNVWVSNDDGETWQDISAGLPYRWVTRVAVDPTDENIAYVTFSGLKWSSPQPHVFRTQHMGLIWEDISAGLPDAPVNTIAIDPAYPNYLYVGTDVSAYYSPNAGGDWYPLGEGLPMVSVYDFVIHPESRLLVAGTHGRSMYALDLDQLTQVETPRGTLPATFTLEQNYPNPFNPATRIVYSVAGSEALVPVSLTVYDAQGRQVATLVDERQPAGRYERQFDGAGLASGLYLYRLRVGERSLQRKMLFLQ
ncbi:MAG: hypothetical protein DKINENOH_03884 [bacterium]|nr:hypothetical protein [bacterium]